MCPTLGPKHSCANCLRDYDWTSCTDQDGPLSAPPACMSLAKSSTAQWLAGHDFSGEKIHCVMIFLLSASRLLLESTHVCWRLGSFAKSDYFYVLLPPN